MERRQENVEAITATSYPDDLVWIDVDAQWPELSSAIANRTIELVSIFNTEQRVTRVRSKRIFLEDRVAKARASLDVAEDRLRVFNEQNRSWRTAPGLVFDEQRLQRELDRTPDMSCICSGSTR